MRKFFNKTWIAIVAAFAVIAGACCSNKNTSNNGNQDPNNQESNEHKMTKKELKERIAEIRKELERREMSCVYGSPEIIQAYGEETKRLRHEADSLQNLLDNWGKK